MRARRRPSRVRKQQAWSDGGGGGEYTARADEIEPVDMRRMFVLPVTLTNKAGDVVDRAQLEVDATMPEHGHGHGMMTEPKFADGMRRQRRLFRQARSVSC